MDCAFCKKNANNHEGHLLAHGKVFCDTSCYFNWEKNGQKGLEIVVAKVDDGYLYLK